jgi:Resolvase, N terminal domain
VRLAVDDQGLSAKNAGGREGFKELTGEVSLGYAEIVLAYEVSRLARNNSDWYALLDVAAIRGTLLADSDSVYDPADHNNARLFVGPSRDDDARGGDPPLRTAPRGWSVEACRAGHLLPGPPSCCPYSRTSQKKGCSPKMR